MTSARCVPYARLSAEEKRARRAAASLTPRPRAVVPPGWLRDEWSTTVFGLPLATRTTCLDIQSVWASKKATVAIHRAIKNADWSGITPLTVSLAICDRVLQLNAYARKERINLVSANEWLAEREADIARTYSEACADLPCLLPTLAETRRLALLVLAWTYWSPSDGIQAFPKIPEVRGADGSVFGPYAPEGNEMDEYGHGAPITYEVDLSTPAATDKLVQEMLKFEKEHRSYAEDIKRLHPAPVTLLPPDLLQHLTTGVPKLATSSAPTSAATPLSPVT